MKKNLFYFTEIYTFDLNVLVIAFMIEIKSYYCYGCCKPFHDYISRLNDSEYSGVGKFFTYVTRMSSVNFNHTRLFIWLLQCFYAGLA